MAARRAPTADRVLTPAAEAFAADLARRAYEVALRHGIAGPFADLELALWREFREVVGGQAGACRGDAA
ncbi:MAG TPA: hypothetical protein VD866_23750 [Urbifossiella sp.]|nr:hypothetical protein [Urbifossiella sp.]